MHDVVIVGLPVLMILAGIIFNKHDSRDLRGDMKDLRSEVKEFRTETRGRFDVVDAELRYFHGTIAKLEGRIDAVEKRHRSAPAASTS